MQTMKRTSLSLTVPMVLLVAPPTALAQQMSREHEVRAAVSAFSRAFVEADVSVLRTLLTEDYVHINGRSGSLLNRDEWLNWIASRRAELDSGRLVIDTYRIEDVNVQIHGEAAVVTGRVRFTNVWVEQGGVWRRAAFHDSPFPESGSQRQ